ncbi:VRR-NUC domain-containing protein [Thermobispora bispora]|uniref:VRR-NUC domain-containing protein n=1 Tax=Thermobispora bispora TaxID=2006 RepID=UPI001981A2CE|nr:VRR-NUC domain-containing protein [Thermobispora bispora]QSI49932.1 VRR-NUC domain-containing protein [Thermobispora bispora]QSI50034.1 VRR-NUC domain-containing protein [Thermobispora bispora]
MTRTRRLATVRPLTPEEYVKQKARMMKEAELRELIRAVAKQYGWLMYFTWNSQHSPKGFPDLVLAHEAAGRVVVRELKRVGKKPTRDQQAWLDALTSAGFDAGVWTPEDWFSGVIVETLRVPREG